MAQRPGDGRQGGVDDFAFGGLAVLDDEGDFHGVFSKLGGGAGRRHSFA
jgi:hypothetical protein